MDMANHLKGLTISSLTVLVSVQNIYLFCQSQITTRTFDRLGIEFTRICDGGVLNQLTRNSGSIVKILNRLANAFTPFLTAYSNMDLGLPRNSRNCESCAAYIADYILDDSDLEVDDSSDYHHYYDQYWRYLHTLVGRDTPERIYERMSHMNSSDALSEFGISERDIDNACRGYSLEFYD